MLGVSTVTLNTLVMNNVGPDGVKWVVNDIPGWRGSPASTLTFTQRGRGDGATESEPFLTPRVISIQGQVFAPDPGTLQAALDSLYTNASLNPVTLTVVEGGLTRHVTVRRQGDVIVKQYNARSALFTVQLGAKDPLKYGDAFTTTTALPSSSGGLTFPITFPAVFTGVQNSGVMQVTNIGDYKAPVYARVDGRLPGVWSINHINAGADDVFTVALPINVGEFVTVDMQRREVLAQAQSPRNGYVTSRGWFQLDPGVNQIAFTSTVYDPSALLTITTMPAWS